MSEKRREGCWSEKKSVGSGSSVFSSVSLKSDQSKGEVPNFIEIPPSSEGLLYESIHSDCQTIFKDLESKIFKYVKNQLNKFKKILRQENMRDFIKDFSEDRCRIKEAALDLTLYFLREMKQDEAADTLEDELIFINQLKCGLQKKYQCVFEGIAQQGDSTLLKNIYTDLYITQGGSEQVNTEHEVRQIEVTSRRHEAQEIQVECRHLFEASAQDKQIRTVMTKGVAGIGKSVSVQKFVLDWAEGKENQEISFIFPLPFREMNLKEKEKLSLMELITQFYPETKGLNLTRRNRYKVLFILDGLDECRLPLNFAGNETCRDVSSPASLDVLLTNLIRGNLLPSALIWITSRPAAASKIPPDCIDRVTEIRGFNDAQKEEYFRKRLTDENQVNKIIDHVKQSKSLFIMCHIPVFCWISATVLQNILQEKRNNDVKNNQADDASKTLQESNTEDTPKTLTQMYTHFLRFQIQQSRRKYNGEYTPDVFWDKDAILSLGKLAFQQLLNNNLIFYDTDLEACGIDVYKASDYSGMCTQIFKEEKGMILGTMYCFVHLSIQEFIAALNAHLILDINKKTVFDQDSTEQENRNESMIDLLKTAVDKALESDNGHLDLFLRFLLGLSLQSNRQLLRGLFTQQDHKKVDQQQAHNDQSKEEIVQYIKQKFEVNLSPERSINLFYCLNELNDQTLVKEIQSHLSKGSLSSADLSPAQWSALVFVLLTSHEEMEEFELQEFKKSDECLIRLSAVIKTTKKALLNDCNLTHRSCSALASVLRSDTSLKELNMSNNNLQDSGVKLLCTGLKDRCDLELLRLSKCDLTEKSCSALALVLRSDSSSLKDLDLSNNNLQDSGVKLLSDGLKDSKLEKLSLSDCSISEEGYKALASALRSNPSHLIELDLRGNDPGQSGVKELTDLQQDPHCTLKTLRFLSPAADEFCQFVSGIEGKNLLLLKELNLSDQELGDTRVNQLSALLQDKHCKLNTLILRNRSITEEQCVILTSALKSNPSHLRELNLSENQIRNTGVNLLCDVLKDSHCKLETLRLSKCGLTGESCSALASVLRSDSSSLKDLDLSNNNLQDSGVKLLSDGLKDSKLEKLNLSDCSIGEESYKALASALRSNPSHPIELDLRGNDPGQSGVKKLTKLLQDPHCTLKTLRFLSPAADEFCRFVSRIVGKNPLLLKELNLRGRKLGYTRVNQLSALLQDKHCKLNTLMFLSPAADEGCQFVTGIVGKNLLLVIELNLSDRKLGDTRVNQLSALLQDKHCRLNTLMLIKCDLTEKSCSALASVLRSDSSSLKDLDLSNNNLQDSGVKLLSDGLKDSKLEKLSYSDCNISEEGYKALASALRSNPSHLIELDLRGNDPGQSGVKELTDLLQDPHCTLKKLRFLSPTAEEGCQFVTGIVGKNPLLLKELNLSNVEQVDTGLNQLSALLQDKHCQINTLMLSKCDLTEESCSALASVLRSDSSSLKDLDLSNNNLQDSGVKLLSDGLKDSKLEKLSLSDCNTSEEGYKALASALRSNPSHLIELDLRGNDPGQSGVKELTELLQDPHCTLKTLRFLSPTADEGCQFVTRIVGKNPLFLTKLNLRGRKLGDTRVNQLSALLQDKHCKLNTLMLSKCDLREESCSALASVLRSDSSSLKDLDLSNNNLQDSGVKLLSDGLKDSKLEKLSYSDCNISEEGYKALASALRSNPSHLIELDLRGNDPGQSGVKELTDLLQDPHCTLKTLRFLSPTAEEGCQFVTGIVGKNLLLLKELNLSDRVLGDTRVNQLSALLQDKHCQINTLMLSKCDLTEESCSALASVLRSDSCSLKDLDLSNNNLQDSGVKLLSDGLKDSKLEKLSLSDCNTSEEGYKALASALRSNPSHLIELDLRGNDPGQSGVKELTELLQDPHCTLKKLRFLSPTADEGCQFVTRIVRKNPLFLTKLNLRGRKLGDTRVNQLSALLQDKHCKLNTLMLSKCDLREESCSALASVLRSDSSSLKDLDLSNNNLQDSGVKLLSDGLKDSKLEKLSLSDCNTSEEGYKALASALRSNPSHLIELDLRGNDPGQSGVKELTELLQDPHCTLKTLRFLSPTAEEGCQFVTGIVGENPLLLKELNLSDRELGDTRVNQLSALLQDKHCTLNTLILCVCRFTEKQCKILTSALKSNPSHLRELDLSKNQLNNTVVNHLCDVLKDSRCKLETLSLCGCSIPEEQCVILTSALKSNPSHLRELDLSGNNLGDSAVKNLSDLLMKPQFNLEKLNLWYCRLTEEQCVILTSALKPNPSHLRELNLGGNNVGDSGVKNLSDLLIKPQFKLKKLNLWFCSITEEQCVILTSALKSNPSHLRDLNLSRNNLGDSGVKNLSELLMKPQFKLEKLNMCDCSITEEQCKILTSALKSNPSHLRELNLSGDHIKNTAVNLLCDVLKDSRCKLEKVSFWNCGITDVSSLTQCLMNTKALQFLKELDLRLNPIGASKQKLIDVMRDSNCKLSLE
nr:protein NLRC5 isoform X3 [Danio rerio]|eukprot:XP_009294409.1 protein NLRC5 isoform X3 [Danio rerio]